MSATVILAMTMISAAATIAIGGFDVLNTDPPKAASAPGAPVASVIETELARINAATAAAQGPQGVVTAVSAAVKDKPQDATELFLKYIHDTIASPMPKYEGNQNETGGESHWYCGTLVKFATHKFTLETTLDEHQKFLAATVLLCRKYADLLVKGVTGLEAKVPQAATATGTPAPPRDNGASKWYKLRWGNRPTLVILTFDEDDDTKYKACIIDVRGRVAYFIKSTDEEHTAETVLNGIVPESLEFKKTVKHYLDMCVKTEVPLCANRKVMLCVLAALVSEQGKEVPDYLDRLAVYAFEADDAWRVAMEGLRDHGMNIDAYEKPVRPDEKKRPLSANAGKCPNRNDKKFKKPNGKIDEQKYKDAVRLYNSLNPGANCS
jgi:hypothetical protein